LKTQLPKFEIALCFSKGRLYQIALNFGSIELQFITEPGLFNRRVVHLLFTVRSLDQPFSSKLVMLVESDPGKFVYECVLCEFSQ
jgi:hypothetical protein